MPGGTYMELFVVEKVHFPHKLVNSELISPIYNRAITTRSHLIKFYLPFWSGEKVSLVIAFSLLMRWSRSSGNE
jgi:hypothetical protein